MAYKRKTTAHPTVHRAVLIRWHPRTDAEWMTFTASRCEAAELWERMCRIHAFCRRRRRPWPTKQQFRDWAAKRPKTGRTQHFPTLYPCSIQLAVDEFLEAENSTRQARRKGDKSARYPKSKNRRYRDVAYKNSQARIRNGNLVLSNASAGNLTIILQDDVRLEQTGRSDTYVTVGNQYTGRLMEIQLGFDELRLILAVEMPSQEEITIPIVGVDLGVNTLIAATDGETALLVSGRGIKALVRYRNKKLGEITRKQTKKHNGLAKKKGSRRWRKLQRAKRKMLATNRRRINALIHKATRQVVDAFPGATAYVGKPFNDAARRCDRKRAQTVSSACNRKIIDQLSYKLGKVEEVDEWYTSQTCPGCGERKKCKRTYRCSCGFEAPRDVVGSLNHRSLGLNGRLATGTTVPTRITYARPGVTRNCARAGIHGQRRPLGDAADVRVELVQGRDSS